MSPRAPSVCITAGCTKAAPPGQSRCPECTTRRRAATRKPDTRPSATARGYDQRWRRTRAEHLRLEPTCRVCGAAATHVDHIDGQGPLGPRGHDHANLQSLCHADHNRKTNRHDGGGWPNRRGDAA